MKFNYHIFNIKTGQGFNIKLSLEQAEKLLPIFNDMGIGIHLKKT